MTIEPQAHYRVNPAFWDDQLAGKIVKVLRAGKEMAEVQLTVTTWVPVESLEEQ